MFDRVLNRVLGVQYQNISLLENNISYYPIVRDQDFISSITLMTVSVRIKTTYFFPKLGVAEDIHQIFSR